MKKLLKVLLACVLLNTGVAKAEDLKLQLRTDFGPVATQVNGKQGVFFPTDDAEYLLRLRTEITPTLIGAVNQQQKVIDTQASQIGNYKSNTALQDERTAVLQQGLKDCQKQLADTVGGHWYTNKWLWFGVGVVAGAATTYTLAH